MNVTLHEGHSPRPIDSLHEGSGFYWKAREKYGFVVGHSSCRKLIQVILFDGHTPSLWEVKPDIFVEKCSVDVHFWRNK